MKNILLITNIYPNNDPSYGGTPVCHFFTTEWVKMGYNVKVVHFEARFPFFYYWVGKIFNSYIQAKTGCVAYTNVSCKPKQYNVDDVPVLMVPLRKMVPHSRYSQRQMQNAVRYICNCLKEDNFVPDAIAGHFALPQLQFLHLLKQQYPQSKTCMVLHSNGSNLPAIYGDSYRTYMESVDVWGFRSVAFKKQFESIYGQQNEEFLCYSGIPSKYIEPAYRTFEAGVRRFSFIGSLYKLKCVEDTIRALQMAFPNKGYSFDIIGGGAEESNLKNLTVQLCVQECVHFQGQLPRDEAQEMIKQSDCFIMVSEHEAFGLVYVEAMAKGLIVVATKGQGIDGIIVDGVNGFLCEAHNPTMLSNIIKHICALSQGELKQISDRAIATAENLTNRRVAEAYLNELQK